MKTDPTVPKSGIVESNFSNQLLETQIRKALFQPPNKNWLRLDPPNYRNRIAFQLKIVRYENAVIWGKAISDFLERNYPPKDKDISKISVIIVEKEIYITVPELSYYDLQRDAIAFRDQSKLR